MKAQTWSLPRGVNGRQRPSAATQNDQYAGGRRSRFDQLLALAPHEHPLDPLANRPRFYVGREGFVLWRDLKSSFRELRSRNVDGEVQF